MKPPRPEPGSGLPAPYEDPWRRLCSALGDVIASVGLRLRELWRRNGEGSLPRPRFWPGALAALFWPLLLAALLAVLLVVPGLVLSRRGASSVSGAAPAASATPPAADSPSPTGATSSETTTSAAAPAEVPSPPVVPGALPIGSPKQPSGPSPDSQSAAAPTQPAAGAAPGSADRPGLPPASRASAGADDQAGAGATSAADSGEETALLQGLLGDGPPPAWAIGVEARAAEGLLRLCLDDAFAALPLLERQRLADRWLARGQERGYERLELVDGRHRPLARTARVGSGMILLDSSEAQR